jgi:hypothetical protein
MYLQHNNKNMCLPEKYNKKPKEEKKALSSSTSDSALQELGEIRKTEEM